jgi:ABC-2 type transport system permease protein
MMIRPFLYDMKRTLTSKSVLIITAIILLISLTIIPLATPRTTNFSSSAGPSVLYYSDGGAFHFLVFSEDQYGNPISESGISLTLFNGYPSNFNQTVQVPTNSSGMGSAAITAPASNYELRVMVISGGGQTSYTSSISNNPSGTVATVQGLFTTVTDRSDSSKRDLQVIYAGPHGVAPTSYSIYYLAAAPPFGFSTRFNESQMTFFQNLTSYHQVFDLTFLNGSFKGKAIFFSLFQNGNGTALETAEFNYEELRPQQFVPSATSVASVFFAGILSFFVPLVAIIGSYSSYGKDHITGVLESVLARPVTRRSLAISRFLSTLLAICIATIGSVGIVDLILSSLTGSALSGDYLLAIISGLLVEIAAFTGLVFLFSHLLKSTGSLLGLSIGLFIFLDFFWNLVIFLLAAALGGTQGSAVYLQATVVSYYANPAQFLNLVNVFVFQSTNGLVIQASNYGLTLPALVFVGIVWSVVPFLVFLILAVKRD